MTTTYKIKSSATRAAKAQFGEGWKEVATVAQVEGGFQIQTEVVKTIEAVITKEVEVIEQLAAIDADVKSKKAKKAEIESRKPAFIPSTPIVEAVKEEMAPESNPSLPAFLTIAPPSDLIVAQAQAAADKEANAQAVNIDPLKPRLSRIDRPTKAVWNIADDMYFTAEAAGEAAPKRKDVIAECVRQGIAYGTARTQYQHWFKTMADSAAAPIAVIGADGKPFIPAK